MSRGRHCCMPSIGIFTLLAPHALCRGASFGGACPADLLRAATRTPASPYRGATFADMNTVLNGHLTKEPGLATKPCDSFTAVELQEEVLLPIFESASPDLLSMYSLHGDRRHRIHAKVADLREEWGVINQHAAGEMELEAVQRDGLCHQAVMWFVHHLSEDARSRLAESITLPLLPLQRHSPARSPVEASGGSVAEKAAVFADYESKVSCQQCHTGPVAGFSSNATLPPPLPVDKKHPGRERVRYCTYQNDPPCSPCEGLGGARWSDAVDDFTPVNCSVVAEAKNVPESQRPKPTFPPKGSASIDGETRSPLEVWPRLPGKYPKIEGKIYLAWDDAMYRQRYDFGMGSQLYLQTPDQMAKGNSSGVMISITNGADAAPKCVCQDAIAGIMHIDSFVPHEPHDHLDLPAEEGGLNYLGRVRLTPIDGGEEIPVVADHYMKWAFHFLVDANASSPTYGLPLRLYGAQGVRFVYYKWSTADPRATDPSRFDVPKDCIMGSQLCKEMLAAASGGSPAESFV